MARVVEKEKEEGEGEESSQVCFNWSTPSS
jgi:hypothetical protein